MNYQELLNKISKPAQRALENAGINSIEELKKYSDQELLKLHGLGPASLPHIHAAQKTE